MMVEVPNSPPALSEHSQFSNGWEGFKPRWLCMDKGVGKGSTGMRYFGKAGGRGERRRPSRGAGQKTGTSPELRGKGGAQDWSSSETTDRK